MRDGDAIEFPIIDEKANGGDPLECKPNFGPQFCTIRFKHVFGDLSDDLYRCQLFCRLPDLIWGGVDVSDVFI